MSQDGLPSGIHQSRRSRAAAAILWTDPRRPDQAALAQAAEVLGPATRARQVLTVIASSSSVWAWLAAADTDAGAITAATAAHPAVRVAVGPTGSGVDGFRRSHFDAVATRHRHLPGNRRHCQGRTRPGMRRTC
jgi:hypothetical protein